MIHSTPEPMGILTLIIMVVGIFIYSSIKCNADRAKLIKKLNKKKHK